MTNKSKGIIWYLVIAFAITWSSILGIYLLGGIPSIASASPSVNPMVGLLSMLGTFGPAIGAFVTLKWITREGFKDAGLRFAFRTGWSAYLWAVLAPIAACVMAVALAGALGMEVSLLSPKEQGEILMEHGIIGRAFGKADLGHDILLSSFGLDKNDNDFVIGLIGKELFPLSALVQTMRKTVQTSTYIDRMGPFFILGRAIYQAPAK